MEPSGCDQQGWASRREIENQEVSMTVAKKCKISIPLILLAFLLAGCESTPSPGTKTIIGGAGGAAAGGLLAAGLGANPAVIAGSVILGGLVGGVIGDRLDAADRREAELAAHQALETAPSGTQVAWNNPDSGHSGTITPTRTYQTSEGQYCREYQQTIYVDGEEHKAYGTACRQPDGSWKIMN
jgi:surface antigen